MSLSEEYTDNFNLSASRKQDNFRTSLSPGATLLINGAFTKGQITYNLSGSHDSSTNDTDVFQSLLGLVTWEATPRLTLTASDELTRNDAPFLADTLSLRRQRRTFTSNTFALNSNYLVASIATREYYTLGTFTDEGGSDTTTHTIGASASTTFYQTNTASVGAEYLTSTTTRGSDIEGPQVTASFTRQLSALTSVGLSGAYALRSVSGSTSTRGTEFRIWSVSGFTAYTLPNQWSLTGSVGFSRLTSDRGPDSSSVTTVTTFTSYHFAPATLTLSGDQGFSQTFATPQNLNLAQGALPAFAQSQNLGVVKTRGLTGSISYPLTPFIGGSVSGFFRENEFTGIGGGPANRTEDTWGGSTSFSIQLLRWLSMGLEYAYTEATASPRLGNTSNNFTENRARLSLNASF